jgi:hypothetical protein
MANVKNQDPNGKVSAGAILNVEGVASEDEALLAVENYLRVNKQEELEIVIAGELENGGFEVRLESAEG